MCRRFGICRSIDLLALLLAGVSGWSAETASAGNSEVIEAPRPNIILMMADDLGWGDVGFNGGSIIKTPNLDRMAAAGLTFNRFYAAAPVCSPTRGSCLTGRHPFRYGIEFANDGHMRPGEDTMAELLKALGYTTGHFGKWHLGTLSPEYSGKGPSRKPDENYSPPDRNGFDEWFSTEFAVATWDPYDPANSHLGRGMPRDPRALYWHNGENIVGGLDGDDSRIIMDRAIPFIRNAVEQNTPFLAVIWFHAPHAPVVGGPKYREMYAQYDEEAQHYYACVTAMDDQIGRLRGELHRLKVADDTMLWFCSDNGPEGNRPAGRHVGSAGPFRGRKRSLFEGGVRVPGLLEWPSRVQAGTETDVPAVSSDYLPTILDVVGASMPDARPLDGISLLPVISGDVRERSTPIAFQTRGKSGSSITRGSPSMALIDDRYKLLTDLAPDGEGDLLFDLLADPGESDNLVAEHPDIVDAMRRTLFHWRLDCEADEANDATHRGKNSAID